MPDSNDLPACKNPTTLITQRARFRLLSPTNLTNNTALSAAIAPATELVNSASTIWKLTEDAQLHEFCFFGEGADDATGIITILGATMLRRGNKNLWVPRPIWTGQIALSTFTGIAGAEIDASQRFADTITTTTDYSLPTIGAQISTQFANWSQFLYLDLTGLEKFGVHFHRNSSATSLNGLYRPI